MLARQLGGTDLQVFPVCLGGNPLGWTADKRESFKVLDAFVAEGGNFIDTADEYSSWAPGNVGGESETIIGQWMHLRHNRDQIVLATKVGLHPLLRGLSPRTIRAAIEESLRRLKTDHVDLYYAHKDDPLTPLEESLETFTDLVREGKVRYLGASNLSPDRLRLALSESGRMGYASYSVLQPYYNLIDRRYEIEFMQLCKENNIGAVPFQVLAQGFLTGKYRSGSNGIRSAREPKVRELYMNSRGFSVLERLEAVAVEVAAPTAAVALAWVLAQPTIAAVIAGASSSTQIPQLMSGARIDLSKSQLRALTAIPV